MVKNVKICVYERCSMILPKDRDPRFITIRRGGTLTDSDHHLLAIWAAICAEHVLPLLKSVRPDDLRPCQAIEAARAWTRGELKMMETRALGGHAMGTARDLSGAARFATYAAGQAAVVAHVAAHVLGAAAYAIKAVRAAAPKGERESVGRRECQWQREQLPEAIRELVLDDQAYATNIAPTINYHGQIGQFNRDCNPGALPQCNESGRQGKFENVVPSVGPVGYSYPWVSIMNQAGGHFVIGSWE